MKINRWWFFSLLWLVAIGAGSAALLVYSYRPGEKPVSVSHSWPSASRLPHGSNLPTLLMFAHPQCPCTRASIGELAQLMTQCQGKVNAQVVFVQPEGFTEDWTRSDLWQSALAIPGVAVRIDKDGHEAARFDATTSGHVVLYNEQGRLLFSGGITDARGHAGDNAGRDDIVGLLHHRTVSGSTTPTFGCPLQGCPAPTPVPATQGS